MTAVAALAGAVVGVAGLFRDNPPAVVIQNVPPQSNTPTPTSDDRKFQATALPPVAGSPIQQAVKPKLIVVAEGDTIGLCGEAGLKAVSPMLGSNGLVLEQSGLLPSERKIIELNLNQTVKLTPTCSTRLINIEREKVILFSIEVKDQSNP